MGKIFKSLNGYNIEFGHNNKNLVLSINTIGSIKKSFIFYEGFLLCTLRDTLKRSINSLNSNNGFVYSTDLPDIKTSKYNLSIINYPMKNNTEIIFEILKVNDIISIEDFIILDKDTLIRLYSYLIGKEIYNEN